MRSAGNNESKKMFRTKSRSALLYKRNEGILEPQSEQEYRRSEKDNMIVARKLRTIRTIGDAIVILALSSRHDDDDGILMNKR